MKKVFIVPNRNKDKDLSVTARVILRLVSLGVECQLYESDYLNVGCGSSVTEPAADTELIIVVGGDGSVIDASRLAIERDIPILGVNLGKVGYLSEVEPDNLDVLDRLCTDDYIITKKLLLSVDTDGTESFQEGIINRYAVNDVVISHDSYLGMADIRLEDLLGNSIKYRADGLIVSTPQGSTAYALSAGGPIVAHDVESVTVTPVCPHSFFNRSVLFNSSEVLKISNVGTPPLNISIDGRYALTLNTGDSCCVRVAEPRMKMLSFASNSMFSNLFRKMKILEDIK